MAVWNTYTQLPVEERSIRDHVRLLQSIGQRVPRALQTTVEELADVAVHSRHTRLLTTSILALGRLDHQTKLDTVLQRLQGTMADLPRSVQVAIVQSVGMQGFPRLQDMLALSLPPSMVLTVLAAHVTAPQHIQPWMQLVLQHNVPFTSPQLHALLTTIQQRLNPQRPINSGLDAFCHHLYSSCA
jgi:hypothetical protein